MCMITYVPNGVEIPTDGIYNGGLINDDGHGWAVAFRNGLIVGKSMKLEESMEDFAKTRAEHPNSAGLFHSRWGTHGVMSEFNVHPFYVTGNSVMAHNGVLPSEYHPAKDDKRSDTRVFVDTVARFIVNPETGLPSQRAARKLFGMIGNGNKLVFLAGTDKGPRARIVNAGAGDAVDGVWYSNDAYKRYTYKNPANRTASSYSGVGYPYGGGYHSDLRDRQPFNAAGYHYEYNLERKVWESSKIPTPGPENEYIWDATRHAYIKRPVPAGRTGNTIGYPSRPAAGYAEMVEDEPKRLIPSWRTEDESESDTSTELVVAERCPTCNSTNVFLKGRWCEDCLDCMDCHNYMGDCLCYTPGGQWNH